MLNRIHLVLIGNILSVLGTYIILFLEVTAVKKMLFFCFAILNENIPLFVPSIQKKSWLPFILSFFICSEGTKHKEI